VILKKTKQKTKKTKNMTAEACQ